MKIFSTTLLALGLCLSALGADQDVRTVQSRLREEGFYQGDATGVYDEATAAAVTRHQIRNGLPISGRLDPETAKALGISPAKSTPAKGSPGSGAWRQLREGDTQFLKDLNAGKIPAPTPHDSPVRTNSPAPGSPGATGKSRPDPHAPPPRLPEDAPEPPRDRLSLGQSDAYGTERLRDYIGAFIVAGLDPRVGAELEFFADRVTYFGEPNVTREKIRRDLVRYDQRWPERRFWLAGRLEVKAQRDGLIRVSFPLRYELRSSSNQSSGKVLKTLILRKTTDNDLEIVAVNEKHLSG